jgi:two-component system sensor histidine kinase KdpD
VVALIIGFLTNRIRFHEKLMQDREERTKVLYGVLQDISESSDKQEFIKKIIDRVAQTFNAECAVVLKSTEGKLHFESQKTQTMRLDEKEQAVALWSFENQKNAGWSTDTLGESRGLYIPIRGVSENVGVFVFRPKRKIRKLGPDQETLLFSITSQLGVSIERYFLRRKLSEAQRFQDSEMLHQTLLNSISHELRTPLTVILSSSAALDSELVKDPYVKNIAHSLTEAGDRLNRVIENLLDMSRLNSGVLALKLDWQDLSDLIGVVVEKAAKATSRHTIHFDMAPEVGLVRVDFRLFEHAISNLLFNAIQYAPIDSQISIHTYTEANRVKIAIGDQGPGIPTESIPKIFDKFYRVPGAPPGGTGLGLSIVKGIVNLHGGEVSYEPNFPKGARFVIDLPIENQPNTPPELPS